VYNPVSLNVIRNSLKLSGMPQPVHIKRLDQVKFPTATVVSAYRMIFSMTAVMKYTEEAPAGYTDSRVEWFCKVMNECFCKDIFTTDWDYNEYDDTVYVTVCTRLVVH